MSGLVRQCGLSHLHFVFVQYHCTQLSKTKKILIYDLLMLPCHVNSFDTVLLDLLLVTKLLEKNQQDDNSLLEKHP